jgi:hypothetical protein
MSVKKAEVEIQEQPKTPEQQALEALNKMLEKPVQPPPIEETLERVRQAQEQAKKAKPKITKTWCCTECGGSHIQLSLDDGPSVHFNVELEDDVPVDPRTKEPLSGRALANMKIARAKSGK